jgi:hypothetical protein
MIVDDQGLAPPEGALSPHAAHFAFYCTSVAASHIRVHFLGGAATHHGVDSGSGSVVHYIAGEVR